jgi:hypothetical protein
VSSYKNSPAGRSADPRKVIIPLTTSLSGIPISGSYQGGGLYDFSAMRKARWSEFYGTQHSHKNLGYDYNFKNRFTKNDSGRRIGFIGGGYQSARRESSSAKTFQEPTDVFKARRIFTKIKGAGVAPRIRFIDTARMRSRAINVYNKANPQNINELDLQRKLDYLEIKQLRGEAFGPKDRGIGFGRLA